MSNLSIANGFYKFWGNIFGTNKEATALLIKSVEEHNLYGTRDALSDGAEPNCTLESGAPLLHSTAYIKPPVGIIEMLLECGADVLAVDQQGNTPLHLAAQFDNLELAILLLGHSANINIKNLQDSTPLDCASGSAEVAALLVQHGGIANHPTNAESEHQVLVETKCDITIEDTDQDSSLIVHTHTLEVSTNPEYMAEIAESPPLEESETSFEEPISTHSPDYEERVAAHNIYTTTEEATYESIEQVMEVTHSDTASLD